MKDEVVDKLVEYLRERVIISQQIKFSDSLVEPIAMDEYCEIFDASGEKLYNESSWLPFSVQSFPEASRVKLTDEELEKLFNYVHMYLSKTDINKFPDARKIGFIFMEIFRQLYLQTSKDSKEYLEIEKYLKCMTGMRFSIINENIAGFIYNSSSLLSVEGLDTYYTDLRDRDEFIRCETYPEEKIIVKDFVPVITDKNTYFSSGTIRPYIKTLYGWYDLLSDKRLSELSDEITLEPFVDVINSLGCAFLDCDFYSSNEMKKCIISMYKFKLLSDEEKEELDNLALAASTWFYDNLLKSYSNRNVDVTEEQATIFKDVFKNRIKAKMLFGDFQMYYDSRALEFKELRDANQASGLDLENDGLSIRYTDGELEVNVFTGGFVKLGLVQHDDNSKVFVNKPKG